MTKNISELPGFLLGFLTDIRQVMVDTAYSIRARMQEEGAPRNPNEKVDWDSPRQQRAWYASGGFGGGIPHQRNHAYINSWTVERQPFGAVLHASHPAGAIGGMPSGWQSRIHRGRWPYLPRVLFEEIGKIPAALANRFEIRSRAS
jgi:hypothetical protein